jgi:hypothetical protein
MSTISTTPKVKSVVNARVMANVRSVAEVLNSMTSVQSDRNTVQQRAQTPQKFSSLASTASLLASANRLQQKRFHQLLNQKVSQEAALRTSTFELITQMPFAVGNSATIKTRFKAFSMANSAQEVISARTLLMKEIAVQHNSVLTNTLTVACANAFKKISFDSVQVLPTINGKARLVASNSGGKTLVAEIAPDEQFDLSISTEIVSGCDSTTPAILDAFDKALEEEGVRAAKSVRKDTGGVCELDTARDVLSFVRRKVSPQQDSVAGPQSSDAAMRRGQRLNDKRTRNQSKR